MSDLDKLMKKLKKDEPKPSPEEEEQKVEELDDDEDEEEQKADPVDPIPASAEDSHTPEAEVGLLQNDGIFRRELLLVEKEKTDVLKVIAQTLLDIKKKLTGEHGGKE